MDAPGEIKQKEFWNDWVNRSFAWENNRDNVRRGLYVMSEVAKRAKPGLKILDVGCGSGWLSRELAQYGSVTATDLSARAIESLKQKHPSITWIGGDFISIDLPDDHFDIVTCLETIAHVPDQMKFARRIAKVIRRGGTLLLTTQNEYIWKRTSTLKPPKEGQIRNWPSRDRLRELFSHEFALGEIVTCAPGGDRGVPRLVNNRISRALGKRLFGELKWIHMRESWGFGCSLFMIGTRR